jgi:hypothetical protein
MYDEDAHLRRRQAYAVGREALAARNAARRLGILAEVLPIVRRLMQSARAVRSPHPGGPR